MNTVIMNGVNIHVEELGGILHGDWHKIGDCIVAYVCPDQLPLENKTVHIYIPRHVDYFYRPARQDKWGTLVVQEKDCELFLVGQEHVKEWYRTTPFTFSNYKQ